MEKNITPDSVISALMNHAKTSDSDFPVHVFPAKMQRIILELNTTCVFPIDYTASAMLAAISVARHRRQVQLSQPRDNQGTQRQRGDVGARP